MIFKRWFKPKWQHPDAAVRQQAIQALHANEAEHKEVLHELAFNDGAEAVRKAALHRLNDFSLWWQASKHDAAERIRQYAEQQLVTQLLQGEVAVTLKQKFIEQCNRSSILEQLALKDPDAELRFALLTRLARADLIQQSLVDADFPTAFKRQLLAQITDEKHLEKLTKQLDADLSSEIVARLAQIEEDKQKPPRLRKELTLLLAKLNALRERHALAEIPEQHQALAAQWQGLAADLKVLPEAEAAQFAEKYQQLNQRLTDWLTPKLAALAAEQAALAKAQQQALASKQLDAAVGQLEQQLLTHLQQGVVDAQNAILIAAASALADEIAAAELTQAVQLKLNTRITEVQQQLALLPQMAAQLSALQQLLSDFASQRPPTTLAELPDAEQTLAHFNTQWKALTAALTIKLPEAIQKQAQAARKQWQNVLAQLKQQQQKELRQLRSKCAEFKRLHSAGRYNILFGLYKGICDDVAALSAQSQAQFEKEFSEISALHADLASLQQYIATPRKEALLAEVTALAQTPVTDAKARAEQVKLARANWNSLGKADPEAEEQLNQAFDAACEAAFEPCRQFFAQQDAKREQHLAQRREIINALAELVSADIDDRELDSRYRQLSQRWREAGAVNRRDYQQIQQEYQNLSKAIRAKLTAAQQQHAEAKEALLSEARHAIALDDAAKTAQVLKELQQRWKTLGFAGRKHDQTLWLAFRDVCDGFFAKRAEEYKQQQQAEQQAWQTASAQLAALAEQAESADSPAAVQTVLTALRQLSLPDVAEARQQYQQLQQQLQSRAAALKQGQQRQELHSLFDLLAQGDINTEQLPAAYRDALSLPEPPLSRSELTLALEIISGKGNDASAAERQQVQLALLSLKHNAGQQLTPEQLLQQWLAHGAVAQQEQPLLKRVAALF